MAFTTDFFCVIGNNVVLKVCVQIKEVFIQ